jgi:biopolymer transport protein ExbD
MKFYTRRRASPAITIVSLIDILTMVLIFFVFTTTFKTQQPQVQIVLPEVKSGVAAAANSGPPVILAIKPNGDVFLDDQPIKLDALGDAVKKLQASNRTLAMKADEKAPFGTIMQVLDSLKLAGVSNVPALTRDKK